MKVKSDNAKDFIECGKVGRAVGLSGSVRVFWSSEECPVKAGDSVYVLSEEGKFTKLVISALRKQGRFFVINFAGMSGREDSEALCGQRVFVDRRKLPELKGGEYYCHQIVGLEVVTVEGARIGKIVEVYSTGANDVYEVKPHEKGKKDIMIPAIDSVVVSVDLVKKVMVIDPLEGML